MAGTTLLIDFPFPAFPDNMGHWAEVLAPAYSCLSTKTWTKYLPQNLSEAWTPDLDAILLINLSREDLQVSSLQRTLPCLRLVTLLQSSDRATAF